MKKLFRITLTAFLVLAQASFSNAEYAETMDPQGFMSGRVLIEKGTYQLAGIELKSNVHLLIFNCHPPVIT